MSSHVYTVRMEGTRVFTCVHCKDGGYTCLHMCALKGWRVHVSSHVCTIRMEGTRVFTCVHYKDGGYTCLHMCAL